MFLAELSLIGGQVPTARTMTEHGTQGRPPTCPGDVRGYRMTNDGEPKLCC